MTLSTRQTMADDGGDFISGTAVTKAFVDQLYDQIDAQAHSTTNPTRTPANTTDEVVTARGSKSSLDARLDVSLNEDGSLKSQASLVSAATYEAGLGSRNVVPNGDLADWTGGGAVAPDNWTLTGAAATIARTGIAMGDVYHFGTGSGFAAKITRAGTNWKLTADIIATADFAKYTNVKGQKFSVAVKGKTAIAALLRIVVDDGVTQTTSSYHTGGNTEEHLSVTHTISNTATKLSVYVEGTGSNGDAYVGGFNGVFADLAPTDWQPLSVIGDANATSKGLVTTGAQTFAGAKTFASAPVFQALPTGLGMPVLGRASADLTKNNSTVLADVTGMSFAVGANETWVFRVVVKFNSSAVANIKFAFTGPAAATAIWYGIGATPAGVPSTFTVTAFGSIVNATGNAADSVVLLEGVLRNGANAGTVQLQAAQNTAEVSNTIVRTDSYILATRMA